MIKNEVLKAFVRGEECDEKELMSTIEDIIRVVISRYFGKFSMDREIYSIANSKVVQLLNASYCKSQGNIVNFLYTGIRNEVGNYLKRREREISVEEVSYPGGMTGRLDWSVMDFRDRCLNLVREYNNLGIEVESFDTFFDDYGYEKLSPRARVIIRAVCARMVIKGSFYDKRWGVSESCSEREN